MTRLNRKCVAIAIMAFCAMSLSPAKSYANEQDWDFVQSVGGMRIGEPKLTSLEWTLPVELDVTGLQTITTKPTALHSGIVCEGIRAEFHDRDIYLYLFTGIPWVGAKNGQCPAISLGHPSPGKYGVYYNGLNKGPVKLGDISIPSQ